jgi:hypothetical protein
MDEQLEAVFDAIMERGFDPACSPWPDRVVVFVVSVQGILDNGGCAYLFSLPFDPPAPEGDVERAFEAIGAHDCAAALREARRRHAAGNAELAEFDDLLIEASSRNMLLLSRYAREERGLLEPRAG